MVKGYVNSIETFGTLDGPGIRVVIFMQGCMLDCMYCHNADMIKTGEREEYTEDRLLKEVIKYKPYLDASKGGITLSGGEPLLQYNFVYHFLRKCKLEGFHTCVDTCCYVDKKVIKKISQFCDMFMVSIKQFCKDKSILRGEYDINKVLNNILYLSNELNKPIVIRHVLIPGHTDRKEYLIKLINFAKKLNSLQFIEVLPYHALGEHKREISERTKFEIPSKNKVLKCVEFIRKEGIEARFNE